MQFLQHPRIQETSIVGMRDPYREGTVNAFAVLKEKEQAAPEETIGYCQKNMATCKFH
jgi:acyl-coenzyme A synthetase/AMP-(fatty) acid ligase